MRIVNACLFCLLLLFVLLFAPGCQQPGNGIDPEDSEDNIEIPVPDDLKDDSDSHASPDQEIKDKSATGQLPADEEHLVVLYVQDNRLMITDGASPGRPLTGDEGVSRISIAPDGSNAIFIYSDMELWVVNLDGEPEPRPLVTYDHLRKKTGWQADDKAPVDLWNRLLPRICTWIEGGRKVAFNTVHYWESHAFFNNDLWIADMESDEVFELLPEGLGGVYAFSPDGTRILVANNTTVAMVDAGGSNWQEVLSYDIVPIYDSILPPQPLWAEDGSYGLILIPEREELPGSEDLPYDYWFLPRKGVVWKLPVENEAEKLIDITWANLQEMSAGTIFSPDRTYLLHSEGVNLEDKPLHFVTLEGTISASHEDLERFYGWDLDGRLIANGNNTLILAGNDGSREEIAIPGQVTLLNCKPLGPQAILISVRDENTGKTSLWLVGPGLEPRLITENNDWQRQNYDAVLR